MNIKKLISLVVLISLVSLSSMASKNYKVTSPNGNLVVKLMLDDSKLTYSFSARKKQLINNSNMGYLLDNNKTIPSDDWAVSNTSYRKHDSVWKPLWGKRRIVDDKFNEITLTLESPQQTGINELDVVVRAYDDGVAFRYEIPSSETHKELVSNELTTYNFGGDYTAWFYNGENHNIGPEKLSESAGNRKPVMTVMADNHNYLALHEANLSHGLPLLLKSEKNSTSFSVAANPSELYGGFYSAWRVILYGENPGQMVDSHMIELLNPDPDPSMDFSWVKPGVAVWDWRINGAKAGDFTYDMSYPSWIRMVDFAAKQGIQHFVLDANWYGPEFESDSDPTIGDKAKDVQRLIAYGKEKGVGIWLYLNDVGGRKYPLEETLKQYGEWGAAGVKYGFMKGGLVEKLSRTKLITKLCAENKLLVNYHDGPIHPYGQMRTWPNAITREYCHAQLDAHRVFVPKTFVTTVFVNMLAGPIDMNNGMFDLRKGHTTRVDESQPVPSTLASEAARTAIIFSGATILPDIPEFYYKYPSLLRFISAQKMPWVNSKTLAGEIGKYIVMMRETETHYLVGIAADENATTVKVSFDFLPNGEYNAELTKDGENAHYLKNREDIQIENIKLKSSSVMDIKVASGGGACILIEK